MQIRQQPFTAAEFKAVYSQVARATVEVIIHTAEGVVLAKRRDEAWHGRWHIPGGTIFYKEQVMDTIQRIAQEELGISVEVGRLVGYIEYPSEEQERGFGWSVGLAFLCTPASPIDHQLWASQEIQFFQELPDNLIEEQRAILEKVLTGAV